MTATTIGDRWPDSDDGEQVMLLPDSYLMLLEKDASEHLGY